MNTRTQYIQDHFLDLEHQHVDGTITNTISQKDTRIVSTVNLLQFLTPLIGAHPHLLTLPGHSLLTQFDVDPSTSPSVSG